MEIQVEKKENNYGLLKISITQDDYMPEYNKEVKEYSKKASIKGFRPGKVPPGLIKKMMGKEFKMEVFNKEVNKAVQGYLTDNEIKTILPPIYKGDMISPAQLDREKSHQLEFEFCYLPGLKFDLEKLEMQDYELSISEEKLEEIIKNIQKNYPNTEDAEVIAKGDFVKVNITWKETDGEGNESEASKEDTYLPTNQLKEAGEKLFEGKKVGDTVKAKPADLFEDPTALRFMIDREKDQMEGFDPEMTFEITKIERSTPAELNQELFDKVLGEGKVTSEEDFKKELIEEVKISNKPALSALVSQELYDKITTESANEYPNDLLVKFLQEEEGQVISEERISKFKKDLDWQSASRQIFAQGDLKVTAAEVREQAKKDLAEQFQRMGMPMLDDSFLENFLKQYLEMEDGKHADDAHNKVYTSKLIDFVKSKAQVEVKTITLDELDEKLKAINEKLQPEQAETAEAE